MQRLVTLASHNIMDGRRLGGLLDHYRSLRRENGLDILCVQENRELPGGMPVSHIARALGAEYTYFHDPRHADLGIVWRRDRVQVVRHHLIPLPRLGRLGLARVYMHAGVVEQKYALLSVMQAREAEPFVVASFHLDAAGDNWHRARQMRTIARAIEVLDAGRRVVACGDTNLFVFRSSRQDPALDALMQPLRRFGVVDPGREPTHYFARQEGPRLAHQVAAWIGRTVGDLPLRLDVMATNMPVSGRGQISTPDSDHDLVWATLQAA